MKSNADALGWAALIAALVGTASAEYSLALAVGYGPALAACVPAALDIYALRAFRVHRDVASVVVALIAVNALAHLVASGMMPVGWPLIVAVSSIAPLVLWRVHALKGAAPQEAAAGAQAGTQGPSRPSQGVAPAAPAPKAAIEPANAPMAPASAARVQPSAPTALPSATPDARSAQRSAQRSARSADALLADAVALDASERQRTGRPATLRVLQSSLRIGQARAQKLREALPGA